VDMTLSSARTVNHSTKQPSVSVIIPTRDRALILEQCLQHVCAQEDGSLETIVVDNSSDPQSTLAVTGRFSGTIFIRADPNRRNPALMRNLGIQASQGSILAFIDDDTLVSPGWIGALRAAFADPGVAGITGRVIEEDASEVCTTEIGRFSPRGEITMNFNNAIDHPVPVEFLYGCNMAIRREAISEGGQFDPWLVMAYEDTELGLRFNKQGQRLLFWPQMEVHHLQWKRPAGVARRSTEFDTISIFRSGRALAYLCVSHFGPRRDFAKVAFINLPKGATRSFVDHPSVKNLLKIPALLSGCLVGYGMAAARALGLHMPPRLNEIDPARQSGDEQPW
jgi:GT2 family glycosyltransferase